jgi:cAMP-dependent protein kinase regulator
MYKREVFAEEIIIRQGDQGDNLYVIDQGKFVFLFEGVGGKEKIGDIEGAGSFGELALMYNCPRSATVKATDNGILWVLDRYTFKQILVDTTEMKRRYYEELLESVPILSLLTAYERMTLADALETRYFEDDECIIRQGSKADWMYFIEEGVVKISFENDQESQVISNATRGDYFGELALVNKIKRSASVYSSGKVICAALDVNAFERLLGPCKDLMKRNADKYENQRKMLGLKEMPRQNTPR